MVSAGLHHAFQPYLGSFPARLLCLGLINAERRRTSTDPSFQDVDNIRSVGHESASSSLPFGFTDLTSSSHTNGTKKISSSTELRWPSKRISETSHNPTYPRHDYFTATLMPSFIYLARLALESRGSQASSRCQLSSGSTPVRWPMTTSSTPRLQYTPLTAYSVPHPDLNVFILLSAALDWS